MVEDNGREDRNVYEAACTLYSMATGQLPDPTGRFIEADNVVQRQLNIPLNEEEGGGRGRGPVPRVPAIADMIGPYSPAFEKELTKSDVSEGQGRLALFKEFVNTNLAPMFNADEDLVAGINVTVFDVRGRPYNMTFKLWASKLYVLTSGWTQFLVANNLAHPDQHITLWMFRHVHTRKLCFAIIPGRLPQP